MRIDKAMLLNLQLNFRDMHLDYQGDGERRHGMTRLQFRSLYLVHSTTGRRTGSTACSTGKARSLTLGNSYRQELRSMSNSRRDSIFDSVEGGCLSLRRS